MKYDFNFWIGIVGFIATLVFGLLSIYLVKARRYPGHITFIEEQVIGLFDSIVKNFPQINITYDNKNIDRQIVLLKGALINSGSVDIKESMVEEKLCLKLPKEFKWLSAKVVDATENSKINLEISDNIISVNLGLFRKNEFLRFEALADVPSGNSEDDNATTIFKKELTFHHRIADTDKVEKRASELELPNLMKEIGVFKLVYFLFLFSAILYWIFFLPNKTNDFAEFRYHLKSDSTTLIVKATPHLNGTIDLQKSNSKTEATINVDEFNARLIKTEVKEWKGDSWFSNFFNKNIRVIPTIMLMLMLFVFSTLIIKPIVEYRKIKKLRQSLQLDLKKT